MYICIHVNITHTSCLGAPNARPALSAALPAALRCCAVCEHDRIDRSVCSLSAWTDSRRNTHACVHARAHGTRTGGCGAHGACARRHLRVAEVPIIKGLGLLARVNDGQDGHGDLLSVTEAQRHRHSLVGDARLLPTPAFRHRRPILGHIPDHRLAHTRHAATRVPQTAQRVPAAGATAAAGAVLTRTCMGASSPWKGPSLAQPVS